MSDFTFPSGPSDGSVYYHEDKVFLYHQDINTWEVRTVEPNTTSSTGIQDVYMTTDRVFTINDKRTEWQTKLGTSGVSYALPTVRTQSEVNDAIMDLLCYVQSGPTYSVDYATESWVSTHYAPINHQHNYATEDYVNTQIANINMPSIPSDVPTRSEFNALVTTVMAAVANNSNCD